MISSDPTSIITVNGVPTHCPVDDVGVTVYSTNTDCPLSLCTASAISPDPVSPRFTPVKVPVVFVTTQSNELATVFPVIKLT